MRAADTNRLLVWLPVAKLNLRLSHISGIVYSHDRKRIQVLRNITNSTRTSLGVNYTGPQWPQNDYPFAGTETKSPGEMMPLAGIDNVPGLETLGYDIFNIHMHGWEVAPHLFHPQGTSNPLAPWIGIESNATKQTQCYCYKHTIADTQSPGDYLYHTHRHGTSTILTWSGMFGLSLTGEETVAEARSNSTNSSLPATLNRDLVAIADDLGLAYDDSDAHIMVIYDSEWIYSNITTEDNRTSVVVSDFLSGMRGITGLNPFFVNNEYQPTLQARTGALSVFRVACISAGNLCAFIIIEGEDKGENSTIIPFHRVASDGITYESPIYRRGNGNPLIPDLTNTEAYLSMGGGMREVVVAQFPRAGTYQIWQLSNAFDDGVEQMLATVEVTGNDAEPQNLTGYTLQSARPKIPEDRPIDEYRGMTFKTDYNQEAYPFPYYQIGDINGENASSYDVKHFDIGAKGGTCGIWIIRSLDILMQCVSARVHLACRSVRSSEFRLTRLTVFLFFCCCCYCCCCCCSLPSPFFSQYVHSSDTMAAAYIPVQPLTQMPPFLCNRSVPHPREPVHGPEPAFALERQPRLAILHQRLHIAV